MDMQTAFNIALTLVAFLGGWVLHLLRDSLHSLQASDASLIAKVQSIELLVAGEYLKRNEFKELSDAIFAKLDKIEEKLDRKADKP